MGIVVILIFIILFQCVPIFWVSYYLWNKSFKKYDSNAIKFWRNFIAFSGYGVSSIATIIDFVSGDIKDGIMFILWTFLMTSTSVLGVHLRLKQKLIEEKDSISKENQKNI